MALPILLLCLLPLINAAVVPSSEGCSAEALGCQNGQGTYMDCNGQCFCKCTNGFAGSKCEIAVTGIMCQNCQYNNGRYTAGIAGYCDLYLVCTPADDEVDENGKPVNFDPSVMPCQDGTMYVTFADGTQGCGYPHDGVCEYDQCKSLPAGSGYSGGKSCQGYWACGAGGQTVSEMCCPAGSAFDAASQSCVADAACAVTCGPDQPEVCHEDDGCQYGVSPIDPAVFFHKSVPDATQSCAPGMVFDLSLCTCTGKELCLPTIYMDFETDSLAIYEDVVERIAVKSFENKTTNVGNFQGEDDIILKTFAGSGFWTDYFAIKIKVRMPHIACGSEKQAIVTNADCDVEESVSITADHANIYFKVAQMNVDGASEIAIPYKGLQTFKWLSLVLEYKKPAGQSNFIFSGQVGDVKVVYDGVMTNHIDTRVCAMHIGYGYNYLGLVGVVDDFEVWRCDPANMK